MADNMNLNTKTVRENFAAADQAAMAVPPALPYRSPAHGYTGPAVALIESTLTDLRAQVHAHVTANAVKREGRLVTLGATEATNNGTLAT